jgi:glycosyl transferase, family 25
MNILSEPLEGVHSFVISLPQDIKRREHLISQLQKIDVPFSIFEAIHGMSLSTEDLEASYDREKALRISNRELSKGEIGCALSHMSIYKKMLAEDIQYALILEDDADILDEELPATLLKLRQFYSNKKPVVVMLSYVSRYLENKEIKLDDKHRLYDTYRGTCAHGYFLNKAAAEIFVKNLYPIHVAADKWEYFQKHFLPIKALVPYSIGLTSASLSSSIEAVEKRVQKIKKYKNFRYYVKKHIRKIIFLISLRPFIRIGYQEKAERDLL